MPNKIWIDVEDLFQYAALNPRPSGIQRIEYELCRSLASLPESRQRVRFVRHAGSQKSFYSIPYAELDALYGGLTSGDRNRGEPASAARAPIQRAPIQRAPLQGTPAAGRRRRRTPLSSDPLRRLAYAMPPGLRNPLVAFYKAEREAGRALAHLGSALSWATRTRLNAVLRRPRRPAPAAADAAPPPPAEAGKEQPVSGVTTFDDNCAPGDVLLVLGSPWFHPFYAEVVERVQRQRALRFALLVYDIIPLRRPEWCDHNLALRFREWTSDVFPLVDTFLTISRASARDIVQLAKDSGYVLRHPPEPIPIGTGFTSTRKAMGVEAAEVQAAEAPAAEASATEARIADAATAEVEAVEVEAVEVEAVEVEAAEVEAVEVEAAEVEAGGGALQARSERLPPSRSYVLIVSTIEARKNHILLFRVWRRLLEEMPRDQIPTLVFAGRVGWLVNDLMQQLRNADYLDGKILLVEDPTDDELETLYAGCRFTLFPSLYEGWGLPVTESLSFGRPCIISRATSLPEAGGNLARYFDPENAGEAYDVIRNAIETPEQTEAWAEQVRREFKPVTWDESARGVLRTLGFATSSASAPRTEAGQLTATHPV